ERSAKGAHPEGLYELGGAGRPRVGREIARRELVHACLRGLGEARRHLLMLLDEQIRDRRDRVAVERTDALVRGEGGGGVARHAEQITNGVVELIAGKPPELGEPDVENTVELGAGLRQFVGCRRGRVVRPGRAGLVSRLLRSRRRRSSRGARGWRAGCRIASWG